MTLATEMKTTALANWFGSNRANAQLPGVALAGCSWIGVVFAGGLCELPHFDARQMVANDLHRHQMNLARVVGDDGLYPVLKRRLAGLLYHPDTLAAAQWRCRDREAGFKASLFAGGALLDDAPDLAWAVDYFVTSWMGRGGKAGQKNEFNGGLSVRFDAGGGGSSVRFWSAFDSLDAWHGVLRRWEFQTLDYADFLAKGWDVADCGFYADPPWWEKGKVYKHPFTDEDHRALAKQLRGFTSARVVVRYGDCPLIRELYPDGDWWRWVRFNTRNQANNDVPEVLILNRNCPDVIPIGGGD